MSRPTKVWVVLQGLDVYDSDPAAVFPTLDDVEAHYGGAWTKRSDTFAEQTSPNGEDLPYYRAAVQVPAHLP